EPGPGGIRLPGQEGEDALTRKRCASAPSGTADPAANAAGSLGSGEPAALAAGSRVGEPSRFRVAQSRRGAYEYPGGLPASPGLPPGDPRSPAHPPPSPS